MLAAALALATPAPVTIRDLVTVTDLSGLAVSPDRRWIAVRTEQPSTDRNVILLQWWLVPVEGGVAARVIADGGVAVPNGAGVIPDELPVWRPDASGFLFRAQVDGAVQVWRADVARGHAVQLTQAAGDVLGFALTPDGRTLTYITGADRSSIEAEERRIRDRGGLVDGSVDLSVGLVGGAWAGGRPASVRMTGAWFDRRPLLDDRPPRRWRLPLIGGAAEPIASVPPDGTASPGSRPDAAAATAFCRAVDCGKIRVSAAVKLTDGDVLVTTTDGWEQQTLWRWSAGRVRHLFRAGGSLAGSRSDRTPCAVTPGYVLCVAAGGDRPPMLVRVDLRTGRSETLFAPNAALAARVRGRTRPLTWRDARGRLFTGQLVLPPRHPPSAGFPLVVHYYRCDGFLRGGVGDELPFYPLADAGVAGLCINKHLVRRPHQDSPADYEVARSGVEAIVRRLARDGLLDPARVGMQGLSFGSETTLWLARRSRLLAAMSIASGQTEPAMFWYASLPRRDAPALMREAWGLGEPDPHDPQWRGVSPAFGADAITAPLLMQLPESEARWSIELFARLARAGKPVEFYAFPDAAHVKAAPRQKEAAYRRNLQWFRFWLQGAEEADPVDAAQYTRWRVLRERARDGGIAAQP